MTALYVHLPFCSSKCHYCAFSVVTGQQDQEPYLDALLGELAGYGTIDADTIYIGGGTPSLMAPALLEQLFTRLPAASEISFEANPEQVTPTFLRFLRGLGVTRVSLGVQTLLESALKDMNRHHSAAQARAAMEALAQSSLSWNADLILGMPGVTQTQNLADLEAVLAYAPPHLSAYFLSIEPGTVLSAMPHTSDDDALVATYTDFCERLHNAGFDHTELSNWSRPGHACRHNLHYWRAEDYIGIGLGASSLHSRHTWTNTRNMRLYLQGQWQTEAPTRLDNEDYLHLLLASSTRLLEGLSWKKIEQHASPTDLLYLHRKADNLAAQQLIYNPVENIQLKEQAFPLHDAVVRYLVG